MNRIQIIQDLIDQRNFKNYLEIGVFKGECFFAINGPKLKIAVDPGFGFGKRVRLLHKLKNFGSDILFYDDYSDDFFANNKELLKKGIDIALVDGLHTFEQSYRDVMNIIPYLNDNGIIIMHDCFPPHESASVRALSWAEARDKNLPGWTGEWCGDVWKAIVKLRNEEVDLTAFVINTDYGLGVVQKKKADYKLNLDPQKYEDISYKDLTSHAESWIGLTDLKKSLNILGLRS